MVRAEAYPEIPLPKVRKNSCAQGLSVYPAKNTGREVKMANKIVFSDGKGSVMTADGNVYNQFTGKQVHAAPRQHKRYRATVVVIRDDKVLLVRDRGRKDYSMPGCGFKKGESTIQAGIREVREELGELTIISAKRLRHCDFKGSRAKHKICQLIVEGEPRTRQHYELDAVLRSGGI